jgi:hypothetical protein
MASVSNRQALIRTAASSEAARLPLRYAGLLPDLSGSGFDRPGFSGHDEDAGRCRLSTGGVMLTGRLRQGRLRRCSTITEGFDPVVYFTKYPGRLNSMPYRIGRRKSARWCPPDMATGTERKTCGCQSRRDQELLRGDEPQCHEGQCSLSAPADCLMKHAGKGVSNTCCEEIMERGNA